MVTRAQVEVIRQRALKLRAMPRDRSARYGADPADLMRDSGLSADPWQAELLRSQSSRTLLLCARQVGKSTATAFMAIREALLTPGSTVLVISPTLRQSGELLRKVLTGLNA